MNILDIGIVVVMILLIIRGIFRGFFREAGFLAGIGLGFWFSITWEPHLTDYLKAYIPSSKYLSLISLGLIFATVFVSCSVIGWALKMLFKKIFLGWADRCLGAGLAVLAGVIIIYVAIVILTFFVPSKAPLIAQSRLAPLVVGSYQSIASLTLRGSYKSWKEKLSADKRESKDPLKKDQGQ